MLPVKPETCTHLKHLKSMVTHRLSCFSYVFLLANSTCWPLIHFFYRPTQRVGLSLFSLFFYRPTQRVGLSLFFCWPTQRVGLSLFFTGQLNVLALYAKARWVSSALVTRFPTCSGNTSWGVGHWQQQETWRRPIPRACMHSQAKPDQSCTTRAKLETTCCTFYL